MQIVRKGRQISRIMKIVAPLLFCLFVSETYAEDLLVPISKFDNDSERLVDSKVLELWGFHNYKGDDGYQNTAILRYYHPLQTDTWRGRIRLDASLVANSNSSSASNDAGQYTLGNTLVTVWGQDNYFLKPLGALFGGRLSLPSDNNGQWAVGPQLGWSFLPEVTSFLHVTDFSPLLRYMYGFDRKNNSFGTKPAQPALQRNLQIYPMISFQLSPSTMLRLWDENEIIYNSAGGGWFVPIDAMITHRLTKNLVFSVGASKQVVQTYKQYDWSTYAKVSLNF